MKTIYFVAGEASADNHGVAVMRALRNVAADLALASPSNGGLVFIGRGGPQMKSVAGEGFTDWIKQSGVLGLWEVIKHYGYFRKQFHEALREIETSKPNAVVLIDYPGFNLRLARALRSGFAKGSADKPKIIYFISPQVWAWNRGRIKKMARWLDLMLCIFPFESDLYNESGLRTIFVGHPMVERLGERTIDVERDPNLIGLFPGSRAREVRKIFPLLIQTAHELLRSKPNLRFEIAAASTELADEMKKILSGEASLPLEIKLDQTAEIMQRAFVGIVASGSATLEASYFRMPFVLVYKVSWITYLAGRLLVKVKYLGMPNVLAEKEIVPEFIQHHAQPAMIAQAVLHLLETGARAQMFSEFDKIRDQLGGAGASERAAKAILIEIS